MGAHTNAPFMAVERTFLLKPRMASQRGGGRDPSAASSAGLQLVGLQQLCQPELAESIRGHSERPFFAVGGDSSQWSPWWHGSGSDGVIAVPAS